MGRYLIVGANGGVGEAIARRLASQGHALVLTAREEGAVRPLADESGATIVKLDVTQSDDFGALGQAVADGLDGIAYAAGTITLKPFERLTDQDFINDFQVNALGAAKVIQACLSGLAEAERGAGIVLFSTVAVDQGFAAHASIAMAKGAVVGLARSLAAEYAPQVRGNVIAPSLLDTPLGQTVAGNARMADAVAKMHPIPRLGQAEDVAGLAAFLMSDGTWITGQVFGVDGGRSTLRIPKS